MESLYLQDSKVYSNIGWSVALGVAPKKAKRRIEDLKAKYSLSEFMAQDKRQVRTFDSAMSKSDVWAQLNDIIFQSGTRSCIID